MFFKLLDKLHIAPEHAPLILFATVCFVGGIVFGLLVGASLFMCC